ncbi:MAG: hypothetical protein ISP41_13535 [Alphaproteobacteria bacterium]|nr:hypothetical protein [Alphaproteobacteria bacterium]
MAFKIGCGEQHIDSNQQPNSMLSAPSLTPRRRVNFSGFFVTARLQPSRLIGTLAQRFKVGATRIDEEKFWLFESQYLKNRYMT